MSDPLEVICRQPNKFSAQRTSVSARQDDYFVGSENTTIITKVIYLSIKRLCSSRINCSYNEVSGCICVRRPRWVSYVIHYRLCPSSVVDGRIVSCRSEEHTSELQSQ